MTKVFAFILIPGYSLLAFSSAIDALRAANKVSGQRLYDWLVVAEDAWKVRSSSDVLVQTQPLEMAGTADNITVCGGNRSHEWQDDKLIQRLKSWGRSNKMIGALSDGSFIVAQAGCFDHHRSTIHWECIHAYQERFPHLDIRPSIFEVDDQAISDQNQERCQVSSGRFSCAGGTAALDLMLSLIKKDHGIELCYRVAETYLLESVRNSEFLQKNKLSYKKTMELAALSQVVQKALHLMEESLEQPKSIAMIAEQLHISERQLHRSFMKHLSTNPSYIYKGIRLERVIQLIRQTQLSIAEISAACGFCDNAHLRRELIKSYQLNPQQIRQMTTEQFMDITVNKSLKI